MAESLIPIRVDCHAGYRGEETPRRLLFGERPVEVVEVVDRWLAPDHRYFKVLGDDAATYLIRHEVRDDTWELIMYESGNAQPPNR